MKRNIVILGVIIFLCVAMMAGCAKKPPLAEEPIFTAKNRQAAEWAAGEGARDKLSKADQSRRAETLSQEPVRRELAEVKATRKEPAGAPGAMPAKEAVTFEDIHFAFDRYDLSTEARDTLKGVANWLIAHKTYDVTIEGHCDERGTTEYNLALGQRRATEAMRYLTNLGIEEKRIKTISYGKESPLDPGHSEDAWAKNRRDHFIVNLGK